MNVLLFILLVELSSCSEDEYDSEDSEKDFRYVNLGVVSYVLYKG